MQKSTKKILFLSGRGEKADIISGYLNSNFNLVHHILEEPSNSYNLIKRRIKKLGFFKVINQLLFMVTIPKILSFMSKKRISELNKEFKTLVKESTPESKKSFLSSVNSPEVLEIVRECKPDIVFVFGTRIIKEKIFSNFNCSVINMHSGITPVYRGVHGGYWALYKDDIANFGVTIHYIDKGIDTGTVIRRVFINPQENDNFATYPLLQTLEGTKNLSSVLKDDLEPLPDGKLPSKIYSHPTLTQYLWAYLTKQVK